MIIVDDEEYILDQLRETFDWQALGFEITGCFTGAEEAYSHIAEQHTDVLLTDIRLGGESGLSLAERVRKKDSKVAMVLLSAYGEFEYAQQAIRLDVYDYMLKPVTFESVNHCFSKLRGNLDERSGAAVPEPEPEEEASDYRIELARDFITAHYGEELSLDDVAAHVSMNSAYFSRFFKQQTGEHFIAYLCRIRMERAAELLADPSYKVYEICDCVGYQSKHHFYKLFKKHTGMTPLAYRGVVLGRGRHR
ncbi:MAG: helix-turn-helix domain-containing protein [Oscillospiraceae bacterium]